MDDRLRKLERAAQSSPDDFVAFSRWKAELDRLQPGVSPGGILRISISDTFHGVHRFGVEALLLVDASGGAMTIILPRAAASYCRICIVKKIDASPNTVTVSGADPSETVEGAQGHVMVNQYEAMSIACDEKAWWFV